MENRTVFEKSPYQSPEKIVDRYYEWLMSWIKQNPTLATKAIRILGISSLALAAAASLGFASGFSSTASAIGALSFAGLAAYAANWWGPRFYGLPCDGTEQVYKEDEFQFKTAHGWMKVEEGSMPRLVIEAENSYDAGYVEGRLLASSMRDSLAAFSIMDKPLLFMGKPIFESTLKAELAPVMSKIPEKYQQEMQGKVDGYNFWLKDKFPKERMLTLEYYLLMQLLPDIFNYNPFHMPADADAAAKSWLPLPSMDDVAKAALSVPGCTTFVLRIGKHVIFNRILDWPSYGKAGAYFLQVDRKIGDARHTVGVGIPLLSGEVTVMNDDGLLLQMNVSVGKGITTPQGMPAVWFNRFLAENSGSAEDIWKWIFKDPRADEAAAAKVITPLSPYHLTFMDVNKSDVYSVHFYQDPQSKNLNGHLVEQLETDEASPQLLVVTNQGVKLVNDVPVTTNHNDSFQRKRNIFSLFEQTKLPQQISSADDSEVQKFCFDVANLPLVKNCKSVLWSQYVTCQGERQGKLLKAKVATDNNYVQEKKPDQFKNLTIPERVKRCC